MDQVKAGRFIAALRHEAGLTQAALGEKIGVTNKTISRWENGSYMPDIATLAVLGEFFGVSINELVAGERLEDAAFRKQADENLVRAVEENAFSLGERMDFWKKKWIREHLWCIGLGALGALGLLLWACLKDLPWLLGLCPVSWLALYAFFHNRMMSYVEGRAFHKPGAQPDGEPDRKRTP